MCRCPTFTAVIIFMLSLCNKCSAQQIFKIRILILCVHSFSKVLRCDYEGEAESPQDWRSQIVNRGGRRRSSLLVFWLSHICRTREVETVSC